MITSMIDLETTDTVQTAGVLSIGVVNFDLLSGETHGTFYRRLGLEQAQLLGTTSQSTLDWWQRQDPAVREEAFTAVHDAFITAIELAEFLRPAVGIYGNGATFDISILEHWYAAQGLPHPFGFRARDCRTIEDIAKLRGIYRNQWPRTGSHHNAIDDATYQATYITGMVRGLLT